MRQCLLYIASSADGYIAREDGSIDWLQGEGDYGYDAFIAGIDTIIMGAKTYDQVLEFGPWPYEDFETIVYSRNRAGGKDKHARFTDRDPAALLRELRQHDGKDIWLVGGGEIVRLFMEHELIDEYHIFLQSVVLGSGIPLFPPGSPEARLSLSDVRRYDEHIVRLVYQPAGA